MLSGLIEWSLGNRPLVIALFVLMAIGGLYSATQIPVDAVPDLVNIQVQVVTEAGTLSPAGSGTLHHVSGRVGREWPAKRGGSAEHLAIWDFARNDCVSRGNRHLSCTATRRGTFAGGQKSNGSGPRRSATRHAFHGIGGNSAV